MLSCIIVDDEYKSRESLRSLIDEFCENAKVIDVCEDGDQAIASILANRPDLVFLDIHLSTESGFDILKRIRKIDFGLIFTTAYSEYAIKAFRFSAIDYLLKPVDIEELRQAVNKAATMKSDQLQLRLEQFTQNLKSNSYKNLRMAIPSAEGLVFINIEEIIYCEASGNYTNFHMRDGHKFVVSRTLKEYEDMLDEQDFFRIHNSYLINLRAIKRYIRGEGGQVVMVNDQHLDVAKLKKKGFLERIKE